MVFENTVITGDIIHIRVIVQQPQWCHRPVRNIKLVICVVLRLMLVLVVVNVVWDLGPPTLPPRKFIVGLMVSVLCDIIVGNIHLRVIHTKKGNILHHIFVGGIIVLLLVMIEVVLVLGKPTSTPKIYNFG